MARTKTKTAVDVAIAKNATATVDNAVNEEKNIEPLMDSDEIEVVSLIPNVSYKDSKSGDMYEWEEVGHVEYMTFDTLKNMWRNNKGYFRNMCLKPNDNRVIDKFSLAKVYERYEYLMDGSNYTKKNIDEIRDAISGMPNGMKFSICNKIVDLVTNEEISDATVIKALGEHLDVDLMAYIK